MNAYKLLIFAGAGLLAGTALASEWPSVAGTVDLTAQGRYKIESEVIHTDAAPGITSIKPKARISHSPSSLSSSGQWFSQVGQFWSRSDASRERPLERIDVFEANKPYTYFTLDPSGHAQIKQTGWIWTDPTSSPKAADAFGWTCFGLPGDKGGPSLRDVLNQFELQAVSSSADEKIYYGIGKRTFGANKERFQAEVRTSLDGQRLNSAHVYLHAPAYSQDHVLKVKRWQKIEGRSIPVELNVQDRMKMPGQGSDVVEATSAKITISDIKLLEAANPVPWQEGMIFRRQEGDKPTTAFRMVKGAFVPVSDPGNELISPPDDHRVVLIGAGVIVALGAISLVQRR